MADDGAGDCSGGGSPRRQASAQDPLTAPPDMPYINDMAPREEFNYSAVLNQADGEDNAGLRYAEQFANVEIDQRDKADDAIDFEDISDESDLPDEEDATNGQDGVEDGALDAEGFDLGDTNGTNGYHPATDQPNSDDLAGNDEATLFGDESSSPEQTRRELEGVKPPERQTGGLALPGRSSNLALPHSGAPRKAYQTAPHAPQRNGASQSPQSFRSEEFSPEASPSLGDDDPYAGLDEDEALQLRLMDYSKRRQAGETVEEATGQRVSLEDFYALFPTYDRDEAPRFLELFPQRPAKYRGKLPLKPPKVLQPTKLSLDLLPDQEKAFRSSAPGTRSAQEAGHSAGLIPLARTDDGEDESDDDLELGSLADAEVVAGMSMADLAMICEDWEVRSSNGSPVMQPRGQAMDGEWETEEQARPHKKRRMDILDADLSISMSRHGLAFMNPERAAARLAKHVILDLNDPNMLIDEHAPQASRKLKRMPGDISRDSAAGRPLAKRYNISNDLAYDLLKENHQHKVRSTLGNAAVEHSGPAFKLQYPFYRVALDPKSKRSFHRPTLHFNEHQAKEVRRRDFTFNRLKQIKRKERKGREVRDLFSTTESLALNDNSSMLLLEYSEEAPTMLSNFGMGNRLINYYRKRNADDQERPKREIGETQVLLTQDKSPFSNFGHVDQGEIVPTIQNTMYRAPVFQHPPKNTDFFVTMSSTYEHGARFYIRNMENLHTVGQQFPIAEVPGEHSRRVTDAAKKRLKALAYRIYTKSQDPRRKDKVLDNYTLMKHLPGHDMPQTRSKMREFMKYERNSKNEGGTWVPPPGQVVPDADTLRGWVRPEDVCLLDSMQVGVQRLNDLGLSRSKDDEDKDVDENANIELQLAPWRATKNFLQATQGKAMLMLHGEGDPTGRGEGFSFVKTSMKGGFQALEQSAQDKMDAKRRKETGGHYYNVAKQQKAYDDHIRLIWNRQKNSLSSNIEASDTEIEDDLPDATDVEAAAPFGRAGTPRSSFAGTPAAWESGTQISRASADRGGSGKILVIKRTGRDEFGQYTENLEKITNPKVIREYIRRKNEKKLQSIGFVIFLSHYRALTTSANITSGTSLTTNSAATTTSIVWSPTSSRRNGSASSGMPIAGKPESVSKSVSAASVLVAQAPLLPPTLLVPAHWVRTPTRRTTRRRSLRAAAVIRTARRGNARIVGRWVTSRPTESQYLLPFLPFVVLLAMGQRGWTLRTKRTWGRFNSRRRRRASGRLVLALGRRFRRHQRRRCRLRRAWTRSSCSSCTWAESPSGEEAG